jgi:hypothetical protein
MSSDDLDMFKAGLIFGFLTSIVLKGAQIIQILREEERKDGRKPTMRVLRPSSRS